MLIQTVLNLIAGLFRLLLLPFRVANISNDLQAKILLVIDYLADGAAVVQSYTDFSFLLFLLGFCVTVEVLDNGYHFVMWILRKIPFLGID